MSFVSTGSASNKWSEVVIDADKDMGGFGLTDLKEMALGMNAGDILCFNAATKQLAIVASWTDEYGITDKGYNTCHLCGDFLMRG